MVKIPTEPGPRSEEKPIQGDEERSLVKRDIQQLHVLANDDDKFAGNKESNNHLKDSKSDEISEKGANHTKLYEKYSDNKLSEHVLQNGETALGVEKHLYETRLLGGVNKTSVEDNLRAEKSVKIRDLKSNSKPSTRGEESPHSSSLSKSFKTLLSKRSPRNSRKQKHGVRNSTYAQQTLPTTLPQAPQGTFFGSDRIKANIATSDLLFLCQGMNLVSLKDLLYCYQNGNSFSPIYTAVFPTDFKVLS